MRGLPLFETPTTTQKKFSITDFVEATYSALSVELSKSSVIGKKTIVKTGEKLSCVPLELYFVNGKTYFLSKSGDVFEKDEKGTRLISGGYLKIPELFEATVRGHKTIVIKSDEKSAIIGEELDSIYFPKSNNSVFVNDRIFASDGEQILFSKDLIFGGKEGLAYEGRIDVGDKITGIFPFGNYILIACEKSLKKLSVGRNASDFSINNLATNFCSEEKTVRSVGEKIIAKCGGNLVVYSDDKVKKSNVFEKYRIKIDGKAVVISGVYILPTIKEDGEKVFYCYDTQTESEYFIKNDGYLVSDGGVFVNREGGEVAVFCDNGEAVWESKQIDFNESGKKLLKEISLDAPFLGTLSVYSDFGKREYEFDRSRKNFNPYLVSENFSFGIKGVAKEFCLNGIKIVYER